MMLVVNLVIFCIDQQKRRAERYEKDMIVHVRNKETGRESEML